jgi:hypothetical protein
MLDDPKTLEKLVDNVFVKILTAPILMGTIAVLWVSHVHNVLEFNFTPPEDPHATKGRLITLLFTEKSISSIKGLITLRQLYRADDDGHFKQAGCFRFVVRKKSFRKATYEVTRLE